MAANRILVVEDDDAISDGIALNLQYSGYEYAVFADGSEAAGHLEADHSFDLALLDIMVPGIDGFGLLEHMKRYNIPVIFLTAKTDVSSRIKGLRDGAEDYVVKPFAVLELLVRIEKILERTGRLKQTLIFKDISVDQDKRVVTRFGRDIALKPLEFDLFVMLVKYKDRTLPRERLLNELWGTDFFGGPRTVDVHIANLRRKLSLNEEIKTISKVGYRLEG